MIKKKRKICVVTGSRAEYGLLYWLLRGIDESSSMDLQLVVTGMHLSPEFGLTYNQIEKDGFKIDRKVENLLSSDTAVGIGKSMGLGMVGFTEVFSQLEPDLVVVLGDRFEIFAATSIAMISRIPIAHIHGGETSEGAFDEAIRHSITKMSHLHFTSTEIYRKRVIQLGEEPARVFYTGAIGVESIKKFKLLSRSEFEESLGLRLNKRSLIVTFHSVTLENTSAEKQFSNLLNALDELKEITIIFTKANADTDGRIINKMIDGYVTRHSDKAFAFTSLGQIRYLSALKYVNGVVGNSSSGIIEAPSFKVGTVNIGDRQRGRVKADSVIDCDPSYSAIQKALDQLFENSFQDTVSKVCNPYEKLGTVDKIIEVLSTFPMRNILKKQFYDNI